MTKKEIFNFVKKKINEQTGPSYDPYQGGFPARFLSETCRSPIGWLLPYEQKYFYKNISNDELKLILNVDCESIELIHFLESLHDSLADKYFGKKFIENWNIELKKIENTL